MNVESHVGRSADAIGSNSYPSVIQARDFKLKKHLKNQIQNQNIFLLTLYRYN